MMVGQMGIVQLHMIILQLVLVLGDIESMRAIYYVH